MALQVDEGKGSCYFRVHVLPRSRSDQIVGLYGDALKVRLRAAPVRGRANEALQLFLARRLGVSPAAVEVVSGHTSRRKRVRVTGVPASAIGSLLEVQATHSSR